MSEFVDSIAQAMNNALGAPLTVFLLSMIPIAEARFAIPFGMSMGLSPFESLGWAFLGTSLITPILLLILIPIINALSKTKFFSKIGKFLYDKFEKKSRSLKDDETDSPPNTEDAKKTKKPRLSKHDLKRMGGTALFVAIPIPLTGVWTGSAVASIVKIGFVKGLISVVVGNAVACSVITLLCWAFADYVNYITLAFFIIAVVVVIALIVKMILYKPDPAVSGATDADSTDPAEKIDGEKTDKKNDSDMTGSKEQRATDNDDTTDNDTTEEKK